MTWLYAGFDNNELWKIEEIINKVKNKKDI